MWPEGYYYQRYMFYSSRQTKDMEKTFVDKLLEHAKKWIFFYSIHEVVKRHGGKINYAWGNYVLKFLRERHDIFCKLVSCRDVVWNKHLRFVTALAAAWKEFAKDVKSEEFKATAVVETSKPRGKVDTNPFPCGYVSDSTASSSSLWNFMDEFDGSDSDAYSMLPLPGIPSFKKKPSIVNCESSPSVKSKGPASSTASNGTPLKKFD
ncbi:UNVERIFIED_CONTAM: hypothetical protein Sindi_1815900 [Sesamum indicum]